MFNYGSINAVSLQIRFSENCVKEEFPPVVDSSLLPYLKQGYYFIHDYKNNVLKIKKDADFNEDEKVKNLNFPNDFIVYVLCGNVSKETRISDLMEVKVKDELEIIKLIYERDYYILQLYANCTKNDNGECIFGIVDNYRKIKWPIDGLKNLNNDKISDLLFYGVQDVDDDFNVVYSSEKTFINSTIFHLKAGKKFTKTIDKNGEIVREFKYLENKEEGLEILKNLTQSKLLYPLSENTLMYELISKEENGEKKSKAKEFMLKEFGVVVNEDGTWECLKLSPESLTVLDLEHVINLHKENEKAYYKKVSVFGKVAYIPFAGDKIYFSKEEKDIINSYIENHSNLDLNKISNGEMCLGIQGNEIIVKNLGENNVPAELDIAITNLFLEKHGIYLKLDEGKIKKQDKENSEMPSGEDPSKKPEEKPLEKRPLEEKPLIEGAKIPKENVAKPSGESSDEENRKSKEKSIKPNEELPSEKSEETPDKITQDEKYSAIKEYSKEDLGKLEPNVVKAYLSDINKVISGENNICGEEELLKNAALVNLVIYTLRKVPDILGEELDRFKAERALEIVKMIENDTKVFATLLKLVSNNYISLLEEICLFIKNGTLRNRSSKETLKHMFDIFLTLISFGIYYFCFGKQKTSDILGKVNLIESSSSVKNIEFNNKTQKNLNGELNI